MTTRTWSDISPDPPAGGVRRSAAQKKVACVSQRVRRPSAWLQNIDRSGRPAPQLPPNRILNIAAIKLTGSQQTPRPMSPDLVRSEGFPVFASATVDTRDRWKGNAGKAWRLEFVSLRNLPFLEVLATTTRAECGYPGVPFICVRRIRNAAIYIWTYHATYFIIYSTIRVFCSPPILGAVGTLAGVWIACKLRQPHNFFQFICVLILATIVVAFFSTTLL